MTKELTNTSDNKSPAISKRKRTIFLDVLRRTGKIVQAAQAAGYADSSYLRKVRKKDDDFATDWDEALEAGMDRLEDEAVRRGVEGVEEPVFYRGDIVGYKLNYSDQLLMFMLKANRPDKFAERKKIEGELKGKIGVALLPMTAPSMEEWERAALEVHDSQRLSKMTAVDAEFEEVDSGSNKVVRV